MKPLPDEEFSASSERVPKKPVPDENAVSFSSATSA
jgi:hypothetical protein